MVGVLQDNDMIIIEPKENKLSINQSIYCSKRFELSKMDNNYIPTDLKFSDYSQMKNNVIINKKSPHKIQSPMEIKKAGHRYQKSDQSQVLSKIPTSLNSPFDRNNLRRSLGTDIAPQYDVRDYNANTIGISSIDYDSESSIFSNKTKPSTEKKYIRQNKAIDFEKQKSMPKSAPVSPRKPAPPPRSPHTIISKLNASNVRTIGNKMDISITKKTNVGLGFTIVARDNQVIYGSAADIANSVVILVNKIIPFGGAAEDNRLRPGDRLLEVNGIPVTSLKHVTEKLRAIPENEIVNLLISRVDSFEDVSSKEEQCGNSVLQSIMKQITFEIPLDQNHRERQQLGLNIKCFDDKSDLSMGPGIYIHSILINSLASKYGDLRINDKLIGINGRIINSINVEETISQLQKVMKNDSVLSITVSRRISIEEQAHDNEMVKKVQNGKLSTDKKIPSITNCQNTVYNSRYSSSDSLSLQNNCVQNNAFSRESKGRRSMSDKRKAHEDASQFKFYQDTRVGQRPVSEGDRLYSTLPTSSYIKKMTNNQISKTHIPVKPSQIKQQNNPKSQKDPSNDVIKIPIRSTSLRNSLNKPNIPQNLKSTSQTPIHDQPLNLNRSMNNSFKRAVQKSLPITEHVSNNVNSTEPLNVDRKDSVDNKNQTVTPHAIRSSRKINETIPRSMSVKTPEEKRKKFNFINCLTLTPNITRTKPTIHNEKSDTFPLKHPLGYTQSTRSNILKYHAHSSGELPVDLEHLDGSVIIDSTKRVLEWQSKNEKVIKKKTKDQKIYQTTSSYGTGNHKNKKSKLFSFSIFACCSMSGKSMSEGNTKTRTPVPKRNTFPSNERLGHYTDKNVSIDDTLSSPAVFTKQIPIKAKSSPMTSHFNVLATSKKGFSFPGNRNEFQTKSANKSVTNDISTTVNKGSKKDISKSPKQSHSHINKYKF